MSSQDDPRGVEDLTPLRAAAERGEASAEERLLSQGLQALYPDMPLRAAPEEGWAALRDEALRRARGRRRRYLVRELVEGALPWRTLGRAAACAGLVALLFAARDATSPPRSQESVQAPRATLDHHGGAPRALRLLGGAELQLERGRIDIEQADPGQTRVALHAGSVRVLVPPLRRPRRLSVSTSDVEIIVHGTQFDVSKLDEATRVAVQEGLVEVRPQGGGRGPMFLRPGERLTVPGLPAYRAELARQVAALVRDLRCDDPERLLERYLATAPPGADVSGALYLQGACAVRRGAPEEAIAAFERTAGISTDPVRADNALARAAQLRAARDPASGADAWRRYLLRFPAGLHAGLALRHLAAQEAKGSR